MRPWRRAFGRLALFHHDPARDDVALAQLEALASERVARPARVDQNMRSAHMEGHLRSAGAAEREAGRPESERILVGMTIPS